MEYITVYEINKNFFPYYIFIPLTLLVLFGVLYCYLLKFKIKNILRFVLPISFLLCFLVFIASIYDFIDVKTNVVKPYFNGKYYAVEGSVMNFEPLASHENGTECFEVGGVKFSYSRAAVEYVGYNKVFGEGGYIRKNGQNVRIRYFYDETYDRNIILKLDILKNETQEIIIPNHRTQGTVLCVDKLIPYPITTLNKTGRSP